MNCTLSTNVSVNDLNIAPSFLQTQKPNDLRIYYSAITSGIQILNISIGVVGIASNLLALIVFLWHKPLLKRPANMFLISQCTINLLVSIMLILMITIDAQRWSPSLVVPMCYLWNSRAIFAGLFQSSIYNIALLTIERYLEIVHPIKHRLKVSKDKFIAIIILGTVTGVITKVCVSFPSVTVINGICAVGNYPTVAALRVTAVANFLVEYFIPIIVFAFCYASMARSLRRISKITQPGSDAVQSTDLKISRARRNIIKTLFIVVLGFIICTTFKQFLLLFSLLGNGSIDFGGITYNVALVLSYCNCCNDPFIYIFFYEEFRVGLRKLFCRFQVIPSAGYSSTNGETHVTRLR